MYANESCEYFLSIVVREMGRKRKTVTEEKQ